MAHDPEGGRKIVEHLGDGLAVADEVGPSPDRAGASRLVKDLLSRHMIRQRLTARGIDLQDAATFAADLNARQFCRPFCRDLL